MTERLSIARGAKGGAMRVSVQGVGEGFSEKVTWNTGTNTRREESGNSISARGTSLCKGHLTGA